LQTKLEIIELFRISYLCCTNVLITAAFHQALCIVVDAISSHTQCAASNVQFFQKL